MFKGGLSTTPYLCKKGLEREKMAFYSKMCF